MPWTTGYAGNMETITQDQITVEILGQDRARVTVGLDAGPLAFEATRFTSPIPVLELEDIAYRALGRDGSMVVALAVRAAMGQPSG